MVIFILLHMTPFIEETVLVHCVFCYICQKSIDGGYVGILIDLLSCFRLFVCLHVNTMLL